MKRYGTDIVTVPEQLNKVPSMRYLLFFMLIAICESLMARQSSEITGKILDANSGESLPSATILIEGTYRGTISNPDGDFSIRVDRLPVTLQVRYIGYQTAKVEITEENRFQVTISMEKAVTEMDEIVVTDRDPGLSIMERVIARKQLWRSELKNYRVDAYTRQVLSNDTSIVSITESSSILYWDAEYGYREIQQSTRQTSNLNADQNFSGVRYLPNFYDDDIEIAGFSMVGITHPDALRFYHFSLIETAVIDKDPVYKIEVIPKRERQPLFEGFAYVHGEEYALLEVDLKPNRVVNFPPPVQDFNLDYKQQFSNYGRDYWLPVDMRIEGRVRIGIVGLQFPAINFRQVSRLSEYEVNGAIPDSIFNQREFFSKADSILTVGTDQIPLTDDEQSAYATIDSTKTLEDAFRPEGFLARMIDDDDDSRDSGPFSRLGDLIPDGFRYNGRFNRVDGFHAGLGYQRLIEPLNNRVSISAGYSFYSTNWDFSAEIDQRIFGRNSKNGSVVLGFARATDTRYPSDLYPELLNSISSVLGSEDYFDYYRNEKVTAGFRFRNLFPYTTFSVFGNAEKHSSFSPDVYDYSLFGWHGSRRPNLQIEEGHLNSVKVVMNVNREETSFGLAGNNGMEIIGEWSDSGIGSDFSFSKLTFAGDLSIPTFYNRRLFANKLDLHFSGGTSTGRLPLQRYGAIDGSLNYFTPFGSLRTRRFLPYEGERYWLVTAEHNFRTIPFELLGLRALVDRGWGIILFGGAGSTYTGSDSDSPDGLLLTDGVHSEAGISLNSIFGILRIDAAKRLDKAGFFIGISVPRYF